jgi:hypothetical protein
VLARALGALLAATVKVVASVCPGRPLHPRGTWWTGRIEPMDRAAGPTLSGPQVPAVARLSRAAGLPAPLPDVHGLAIRWQRDGRPQEILLSSSGRGPLGRFLLIPRRRALRGAFSTLMPFSTTDGPLLLGAAAATPTADGGFALDLLAAPPAGTWHRWARLTMRPGDPDETLARSRFDPVLHCPDGLSTYRWAAALRLPAYRTARRSSTADLRSEIPGRLSAAAPADPRAARPR